MSPSPSSSSPPARAAANASPPRRSSTPAPMVQRAKDGVATKLDPTDVHEAEARAPDAPSTRSTRRPTIRRPTTWRSSPTGARSSPGPRPEIQAEQTVAQSRQQVDATRVAQLQNARGQLTSGAAGPRHDADAAAAAAGDVGRAAAQASDARGEAEGRARHHRQDRVGEGRRPRHGDHAPGRGALQDRQVGSQSRRRWPSSTRSPSASKGRSSPSSSTGTPTTSARTNTTWSCRSTAPSRFASYLVSKGLPQDLLTAQGKGPDMPIADNQSIEGRAQNRRVEIVVAAEGVARRTVSARCAPGARRGRGWRGPCVPRSRRQPTR